MTPHISKRKNNLLLKAFAEDVIAHAERTACASKIAKVNANTANYWYRHFREAIYIASRKAPRLFGEVEMDQKAFGGRGRKRMNAALQRYKKILPYDQYQAKAREIRSEHKTQVFGILQRGANVYVHIIKKADKATLMPIVRLVVEPGTVVYTDAWRGFTELGLNQYEHHSINHSLEYTNKQGHHINGIESFWSFCHRRLAKFNGIHTTTLPLHLKECEFRFNNKDVAKALKALLKMGRYNKKGG